MKWKQGLAALGCLLLTGLTATAQAPERVPAPAAEKDKRGVEEIIARVNNEIVTLTDIRNARAAGRTWLRFRCSPAR